MSENGEIYTAGKNFTLPPALTALTNSTSAKICPRYAQDTEVEFVHPVSPGGSVKFVASGVNFSIFTNFLCFFLLKLLKLGEIGGVKFLT